MKPLSVTKSLLTCIALLIPSACSFDEAEDEQSKAGEATDQEEVTNELEEEETFKACVFPEELGDLGSVPTMTKIAPDALGPNLDVNLATAVIDNHLYQFIGRDGFAPFEDRKIEPGKYEIAEGTNQANCSLCLFTGADPDPQGKPGELYFAFGGTVELVERDFPITQNGQKVEESPARPISVIFENIELTQIPVKPAVELDGEPCVSTIDRIEFHTAFRKPAEVDREVPLPRSE